MSKYLLYGAIAFIVFTVSCCYYTPEPDIIRLKVDNRHKFYIMGAEYVKIEMGGIETNTAFIEAANGLLIFDVTVTNLTSHTVRVDPRQFYYIEVDTARNNLELSRNYANDPEYTIIEYDRLARKEEINYGNKQFGMAALGIAHLVTDMAVKDKSEEETEANAYISDLILTQMDKNTMDHDKAVAELNSQKQPWIDDALRITDLNPNEYIRGNVYFPVQFYAKRLKLFLIVAGTTITLDYNQYRY